MVIIQASLVINAVWGAGLDSRNSGNAGEAGSVPRGGNTSATSGSAGGLYSGFRVDSKIL